MTPVDLAADEERDAQGGLRRLALEHRRLASPAARASMVAFRASAARVSTRAAEPINADGSSGKRTPRSMVYGKWISVVPVEDPDVEDLGVEDVAQLVADEVVHRLDVDLGGQALLDPLMIASSAARSSVRRGGASSRRTGGRS